MNPHLDPVEKTVDQLLPLLANGLNDVLAINYPGGFWKRYLSYWLTNFLDVVYSDFRENQEDSVIRAERRSCFSSIEVCCRYTSKMSELLEVSQRSEWRKTLRFDIYQLLGTTSKTIGENSLQDPNTAKQHRPSMRSILGSKLNRVFMKQRYTCATTYLPRSFQVLLSLSLGSIPIRWIEPNLETGVASADLRTTLKEKIDVSTDDEFVHLALRLLPQYLPLSCLELVPQMELVLGASLKRPPSVLFTANQHFASDSFAFWAARCAEGPTQLCISQHGGLNGQGWRATRDEEVEQSIADLYLHWGWSSAVNGVKIPSQLTVWKRPRNNGCRASGILLVTDATFRFQRKWWSDSPAYKALVLRTYGALPQEAKCKTTIRLHRDHDRYDDSHIDLWKSNYPEVQIDSGLSPMRKLLKSSELVICTTLGTTEIECFYRNIPVVMSLDPQLHRPRPEFEPLLQELEQVGIVHFSDESLRRFFETEFEHLLEWWTSEKVRSVVIRYLDRYAYSSRTPFRDYRRLLRQAASEKK